jgi:hypothetical protein
MAGVRAALDEDPGLLELCRSPLLLQIVALAYRDAATGDLGERGDPAARRDRIIGDYVDQRFRWYRPVTRARTEPERARQWLIVLARNLRRRETPVLHLEDLDSDWLPSPWSRAIAVGTPWLVPALIIGAMVRPVAGLIAFLCTALAHRVGLQPDEWSVRNVARNFRTHIFVLPILGLLGGLGFAFTNARVLDRMSLWPLDVTVSIPLGCAILGIVGGVVVAPLLAGFGDYFPATRHLPYEVVKRTARVAAVVAVLTGLVTMVLYLAVFKVAGTERNLIYRGRATLFPPEMQLYNAAVVYGIAIAVLYVVIAGWGEVTRLGLARVLLWIRDLAPIRYVTWLEELVRLRLIYRGSGGYVFIHELVQEQIAGSRLAGEVPAQREGEPRPEGGPPSRRPADEEVTP